VFDRLHADGVALVVSVDCGIRGAEAARRARELGIDLIITDQRSYRSEEPTDMEQAKALASDDFPEPETPVKTTNLFRGTTTSMFLRLCSRAPRMTMESM